MDDFVEGLRHFDKVKMGWEYGWENGMLVIHFNKVYREGWYYGDSWAIQYCREEVVVWFGSWKHR